MHMAKGHENVIPLTRRTKDEQWEIRHKGGLARGAQRRQNADLKKLLPLVLGQIVNGTNLTYAQRITLAWITKAANGDMKAIRLLWEALYGKEQKVDMTSSDGSMTPRGVNMDLSKYSPEQLAEIARAAFRGE